MHAWFCFVVAALLVLQASRAAAPSAPSGDSVVSGVALPTRSLAGHDPEVETNTTSHSPSPAHNETSRIHEDIERLRQKEKGKGDIVVAATLGALILLAFAVCFGYCLWRRYVARNGADSDVEFSNYMKKEKEKDKSKYSRYEDDEI